MPIQIAAPVLTTGTLSLQTILLGIITAFLLCFFVALVYRATHRGLSYSQGFTVSLILIGFLIAGMVMIIGNSFDAALGTPIGVMIVFKTTRAASCPRFSRV